MNDRRRNEPSKSEEHLRLLAIFHYVYGGISVLFSLFPVIYIVMGIAIVNGNMNEMFPNPNPVPQRANRANNDQFQQLIDQQQREAQAQHDRFQKESSKFMGWMFITIGCVGTFIGLTVATFTLIAGRKLTNRSGHTFCLVIACIECLSMPLGTVLGVFTLVVLSRPEVKEMFGKQSAVDMGDDFFDDDGLDPA